MSLPAALSITGVSRHFGARAAVSGVTLDLRPGRITCLLGPSGCGKSTLLRLVAGLERPDAGEIRAGDTLLASPGFSVPPERRRIGLVFQDFSLFPHLDAAANVAFGLGALPRAERRARALALLERFALAERAASYPHQLSGGEQQRVAIARALAPGPAALLLDEPFSGLDGPLRAQMRATVMAGLRASGTAVLMVTHDPEEAMLLADELALMHDGRLLQVGTAQECYLNPASAAAARMLGPANILPATVDSAGVAQCAFGRFAAAGAPAGAAQAMLRPEAIEPVAQGGVAADVIEARFAGACYEVRLRCGEAEAVMRTSHAPPAPGARVEVAIQAERATILPPDEAAPGRRHQ